jgi:hypothetical protein
MGIMKIGKINFRIKKMVHADDVMLWTNNAKELVENLHQL